MPLFRFAAVAALLLLAACASTPQSDRLLQGAAARHGLPPRVELSRVPYFPQDALQCGPATLAMVMDYLPAKRLTPEDLYREVFTPGRKGSLQMDMIGATRRHGLLAYVIRPEMADLFAEVNAGHPVIILQNLSFNWYPVWHYAVVVGYDLGRGDVILRSGPDKRQILSMRLFERTWARGGRWGLLVLPPGQLPARADPRSYLSAVLGLEQARRWDAAARAYRAALARWPDSEGASLGLGNSEYAQGRLAAAAAAFRDGVARHPDSAALNNNLAQTLLDLHQPAAARPYARRAIALDGKNPSYRDTWRQVETALQGAPDPERKKPGA